MKETFHKAYGDATELPASQHADANFQLRVEAVGPEARRALSDRWLAMPGMAACSAGARPRLSLLWGQLFTAFKRLNAAKAPVSAPLAPSGAADEADDDDYQARGAVGCSQ